MESHPLEDLTTEQLEKQIENCLIIKSDDEEEDDGEQVFYNKKFVNKCKYPLIFPNKTLT